MLYDLPRPLVGWPRRFGVVLRKPSTVTGRARRRRQDGDAHVIAAGNIILDRPRPRPLAARPMAALVVRLGPVYQGGGKLMGIEPEAREAAEVMARYCRGDAAAFQRLYALLAPRILAYLTGLLGDKAAAEDMLQLTFLKVHEARGSYVLGANPIPGSTRSPTAPAWTRSASASAAASGSATTASWPPSRRRTSPASPRTRIPIPRIGPTRRSPPARWPRWRSCPRTSARR